MHITSTRFGKLEVAEHDILRFPDGLPGFQAEKLFALLPHQPESPFAFLQSATDPDLTFLLADPFAFFQDYEFVLDDALAEAMGLSPDNPPQVLLVATMKGALADLTVNLVAPLVVNRNQRIGRQIILNKPEYSICHKVFPHGLPQAAAAEGGR